MKIVGADLVSDACLESEVGELFTPAVVEDVDVQLVCRPVNVQRAQRREAHHVERLVVGRNQNVDVRPVAFIVGQCYGRAAQRPDGLEIAQEQNEERIGLGQDQAHDEEGIEHSPMIGRVLKEVDGGGNAPIAIAERAEQRHDHQGERDQVRVGTARHGKGNQQGQKAAHCLLGPGQRQNRQKCEDPDSRREEQQAEKFRKSVFSGSDVEPEARWGHFSLQRTPRYPLEAGAARLFTQPARLAKSSATVELGA